MDTNQPTIPETNDLPPAVAGQEFQAPEISVNVAPVENNPPVVPPTPKTKGKLMPILLIILILVLLGVGGLFAYKNFFVTAPEPTPTPISTPESTPDPIQNWEVYSNSTHKISFKYPASWVLVETKGQVENGETYNTIVKLTKNEASINLHFNMNGLGGMPQTYEGKPFTLDGHNLYRFNKINSYDKTKEVGLSNSLTTLGVFEINDIAYLINITYPETMSNTEEISLLEEFDQILSTFKFTEQPPVSNLSASYSIQIPISWIGKYLKTTGTNCDSYDFKGQTLNSNIFSICRMTQQEWTENQNLSSALKINSDSKLASSIDYVYFYKISLSNDYSGDEADLYQTFAGNVKDIVNTFKLK